MFAFLKIRKARKIESELDLRLAQVDAEIDFEKAKARAELAKARAALVDCERKAEYAPGEFSASFRAELACRRAIVRGLESLA
jgi:hypothetical protein